MKVFDIENGKEIVFVQNKDLRFLCSNIQTPSEIKNLIPISACSLTNEEEYMKFDNEDFINYLKTLYFVLDFNEFSKMTNEEIFCKFKDNQKNKNKVFENFKNVPKKERKKQLGLYAAFDALSHYENDILKFLEFKKINLPDGKIYINKKD